MQLSPLQSRLAASVIASCLLLVIYLFLFSPPFALAAELAGISVDNDARDWTYDDAQDAAEPLEVSDPRRPTYEPGFALFDRSIIGRQAGVASPLADNELTTSNLAPGITNIYVFSESSVTSRAAQNLNEPLELRRGLNESGESAADIPNEAIDPDSELVRRQSSKTLWISANTCQQPWPLSTDQPTVEPPQLVLYVSTSADNTSPGPLQSNDTQRVIPFNDGAVMFNISLDGDVYMSITAPTVSAQLFDITREYNFNLVASTEQYYYSYDNQTKADLVWTDSDAGAALLQTNNLTSSPDQQITTMPYVLFAHNQNDSAISGMRNSYCGLSLHAQIRNLDDGSSGAVTMGLKQGGDRNLTRQQFYVSGLNASSKYVGILARPPGKAVQKRQDDSSSVGGGVVFQPVPFETKPNGACTVIFNLTLCDQTQYAVPGNQDLFPNVAALAAFYENYTQTMWDNFDKVLQQVPCNTSSTAQYSLARNCDDCKIAYKNWLCSVAIPRCEDFSTPPREGVYLHERNIAAPFPNGSMVDPELLKLRGDDKAFSSSRNPAIDETVQPGPYKELLPCDNVCYELVRSCPASMGFACPRDKSMYGYTTSYGRQNIDGSLSCNYPGAAHFPGAASTLSISRYGLAGALGILLISTILL